jgi:hypothetical protein
MAKIKGIELKKVNDFKGHEGEQLTQGDVYYKGKKVGYYSQDAWGGMDIFNLDYDLDDKTKKEVNDIVNNYIGGVLFKKIDDLYDKTYNVTFEKPIQKGYEYFFMDLMQLNEHEKLYKKYNKKFNNDRLYIIYNDLFNMSIYSNKNDVNMELKFPNKTYFEYNSLKDFVIE